jgi:hypothetical protein
MYKTNLKTAHPPFVFGYFFNLLFIALLGGSQQAKRHKLFEKVHVGKNCPPPVTPPPFFSCVFGRFSAWGVKRHLNISLKKKHPSTYVGVPPPPHFPSEARPGAPCGACYVWRTRTSKQ